MSKPENLFPLLEQVKPRLAPLSFQRSPIRALERLKRNFQDNPSKKTPEIDPKPAA